MDARKLVATETAKDLEELGPIPAGAGLAAVALELARQLDDRSNSATSKSMCARALLDTMNRLRELKPPEAEADPVDDLSARVVALRARG